MGQVSSKLRRATDSYFWFCPGCEEMHPLPDRWTFNGNLDKPTFSPSFRHTWGEHVGPPAGAVADPQGRVATDGQGKSQRCCHYIVTDGKVAYCGDSTHGLAGQTIDMPDLPPAYQDQPKHPHCTCDTCF